MTSEMTVPDGRFGRYGFPGFTMQNTALETVRDGGCRPLKGPLKRPRSPLVEWRFEFEATREWRERGRGEKIGALFISLTYSTRCNELSIRVAGQGGTRISS